MPLSPAALRRFVRHALVTASGVAAPDAVQLAASYDVLCDGLRRRLHPLFGTAAINALFQRGLHLSAAEFPWVTTVLAEAGERCSVEGLERVTGRVTAAAVAEGLATVLAHDIGLLATFIGEDFVMPLVQEAWGTTLVERPGGSRDSHE